MSRGNFITFEGGEGAGKSTQIAALAGALRRAGLDCLQTREPGGTPAAEDIRKLLVTGAPERWDSMSEALLHWAARRDHLERLILPALGSGTWVLSDRFADSTLAYQGYGHGLGLEAMATLQRLVAGDFAPDLTLILDLDPALGLARARSGREDRYERMDLAFHKRLRQGFLEIARSEPERCRVIDAAQPMEAVQAAVLAAVSLHFSLALSPQPTR